MDDEQEENKQPAKKTYGKRPVWQWVVIYLIAAVIVYGLIYILFIHKATGSSY